MSSEVEVKPTSPIVVDAELIHDSEEYESAEEIEGEEYDEEEVEIEEIEVEVEEEEEEGEGDKVEGTEKALDDDEDRKNPQFIPKKGYFYEHDDRMHGEPDVEDESIPKKEEKPRKESTGKVITDRWSHDLFDENDQAPKSHVELEERYGYDIRGEDMAPRARRRRAYGRGPTKYNRNWEDEEAYQRPRGGFRGRRGRGRDFQQPARRGSKGYDAEFPNLSEDKKPSEETSEEKLTQTANSSRGSGGGDRNRGGRGSSGGGAPPRPRRPEVDDRSRDGENEDRNSGRGHGRGGRGRGGRRSEFSNRNRYPDRHGNATAAETNNNSNSHQKTQEERNWEQQVDRMREQDKQKQSNGPSGQQDQPKKVEKDSSSSSKAASSGGIKHQQQLIEKKSTLPFTNTEYTGSASLTAKRNQDSRSNASNTESGSSMQSERENISVKLVNAGPDQGSREVRISEKDEKGRRPITNQNYGIDRRSQIPPRLQQQQQHVESAKPKRFSSQRPKQDAPLNANGPNASPVSASPPLGPGQTGVTMNSSQHQPQIIPVPTTVPVSVMAGYPPHPQPYYEQGPMSMPTNYETQGYEASGSPITVPITVHGPSVSPSLWGAQHPVYSASPYPSPPTGPPPAQPQYDPSAYIAAPPQQIFAPPPHPHPQFISDPTIINYVPPGPPPTFGAPFHTQGFQAYPPVNPGPPELYHGGVTYYSPQNQIQRPHMMVPTKRAKSVLQLVEPPKRDMRQGNQGPRPHLPLQEEALLMSDMYVHQYREESLPHVVDYMNMGTESRDPSISVIMSVPTNIATSEQQLSQKFESSVTLQPKMEGIVKKSPSPAPLDLSEPSWADQMTDLTPVTSPTEHGPLFAGSASNGDRSLIVTEPPAPRSMETTKVD